MWDCGQSPTALQTTSFSCLANSMFDTAHETGHYHREFVPRHSACRLRPDSTVTSTWISAEEAYGLTFCHHRAVWSVTLLLPAYRGGHVPDPKFNRFLH